MNSLFKNILRDMRVELSDEFDQNFERKAFFDDPWAPTHGTVAKGSLLLRTGALRSSIQGRVEGMGVVWESSLPYASMQNDGGTLTVTKKMISFFWAMYYKANGALSKTSTGKQARTKRNARLIEEATSWKYLALMKVGDKITIPARRFIGEHPTTDRIVDEIVNQRIGEFLDKQFDKLIKNLK